MTPDNVLEVEDIRKRFGPTVTAAGITLAIVRGEFFTFLGPSGSGKSTLLRMIAGLEEPDSGRIYINGADMAGVPAWKRDLGMMFQNYAVFPHMSVLKNVTFGLRMRGVGRGDRERRAMEMLELVGLSARAHSIVTSMSGGEQQRVALARALAPRPKILLLDEPLSALDEKIRREMQEQLKAIQKELGTTFVYVTHDQEEALTMSDRVAVFNHGRCVQVDEPHTVHRLPRTRFVAQFFRGANIISAKWIHAQSDEQSLCLEIGGVHATLKTPGFKAEHEDLHIAVRAEKIRLGDEAANSTLRWKGHIRSVVYRGANTDYDVDIEGVGRTLVTTISRQEYDVGQVVDVGWHEEDVALLED
ncbi:MAG TPA: ABC transporter ATP-binding protein [Gammaproteobacteria bacterium]|nr:ABC transporter ATP-binding protein [Gammaproteobacteria bacterium]